MSLAERHQAGPPARKRRCSVCTLLSNLPKAEATALQGMLEDPDWSSSKILAALQDEGHLLNLSTYQAIGHHRRDH